MSRIVIIGAGAMGLAAAHRAVSLGHSVDLVEADAVPGGMAAHFDVGGVSIERFYHFVCKSDQPTFDLLAELGLGDAMRWTPTSMAYFMKGKVHPWGDPFSLLRFPHLSLTAKIRTGLQMFWTTKRRSFAAIEAKTAREWIEGGSGREVYETLWKRLIDLKFFELADDISASWIAVRIRRIGNSRRSIFREELGYIDGGSQTLVDALVERFAAAGGRLHLATPAERVEVEDGRVRGLHAGGRFFPADAVISTVPTPYVPRLAPDLPEAVRSRYAAIRNIGVVCLLFRLKRPVTGNFWLNIVDDEIDIPGIIEFSNLRPLPDSFVYVPYYMPHSHEKWGWSDAQFIDEAFGYIRKINPEISSDDLMEANVSRLRHAQPVCEPNFGDKLPPMQTPIEGLLAADTSYYYPEDRGIAESVRLGRQMAEIV
ncbi:NAD(P)/FAD-dependent oxidoreductase [Breoghania sp.]|uniref:NAD(P)/FAD-dependent oxidoreductase n=1 Tax=Breoghania sp. TaxID=2065378 RepID=UPI002AA78DD8|nr:NAD(P)/FAD-dependent oxidoreductase [Breoghania sp.]